MTDDAKILGEAKVAQYKEAFSLFDKKRDGTIAIADLGTLMRAMGSNPTEAQIQDLKNEVDAQSSGRVTFPEFLHCMTRKFKPPHTADQIIASFKVLDHKNSGAIAASDLGKLLTNLGERLSAEEFAELLKVAGADSNGSVNYEAFVKKVTANK